MKNYFRKKTYLEQEYDKLAELIFNNEDYNKSYEHIEYMERLQKLIQTEQQSRISPDTKAMIAANIVSILIILHYEKLDVITSEAMKFISKGRVN